QETLMYSLVFNGLGSKSIMLTLIIFGLFYGVFGVLRLAVYLDIFLILGALVLLIKYYTEMKNKHITK
ncbi:MAG: hypothetical protein MUD10_03795, partial [Candidatus Pacebacteria bacterium]|nr:hypothetical protein [Candidatus Paceibacterota bacterium]